MNQFLRGAGGTTTMKQSIQIAYNYLKNQNFNLKTLKKAISKPRFPGEFDQAFNLDCQVYALKLSLSLPY